MFVEINPIVNPHKKLIYSKHTRAEHEILSPDSKAGNMILLPPSYACQNSHPRDLGTGF